MGKQKFTSIVLGLGEVGKALYDILHDHQPTKVWGYDPHVHGELFPAGWVNIKRRPNENVEVALDIMHVCFPWQIEDFVGQVQKYQERYRPEITVIHSTVPIGTTAKIKNAVHSPVMGRHDNMKFSIQNTKKWIGGPRAIDLVPYFRQFAIACKVTDSSEETEALKLLSLAKYGMSIAFAEFQQGLCDTYGFDYQGILDWDAEYNRVVIPGYQRPLVVPPRGPIGGHCVIPGAKILNEQHPHPILAEILKFDKDRAYKAWQPSNVYPSARIGNNVNIGAFTEIGPNVEIGDDVRIGAMCFIPEGVSIEDGAWIGPRVTFSNDTYPPSGKNNWKKTRVHKGARIGAGVCILPGITIGEGALIGMGAVITKNVKPGEVWVGNPARKLLPTYMYRESEDERVYASEAEKYISDKLGTGEENA